ncbi:MAG: stage V sporulation protein SpoVM [Clostridia bacterium]|nr:stage V sporulation protein SpoVM [Clostridia bacterium]
MLYEILIFTEAIFVKVVVVKSPKLLGGFLRMIFGIKKNKD